MTASATDLRARAAALDLHRVDPSSPPALAAVRAYLVDLDRRVPQGFDVEAALAADAASRDDARWVFVIATDDDATVAGGGLRVLASRPEAAPEEPTVGEIKRMWVHEGWRGAGLGGRLLRRLEEESRALGLTTIRLDSHRSLTEAVAMYGRAGYREIPRYNDNPDAQAWFEKRLPVLTPPG